MKRFLALFLTAVMLLAFSGCTHKSDLEKIKEKGKIVVGVTELKPVNFKENGEWTGFDTELAKLFAKELGLEIEFKEIVWAERYDELIDGNIDCVWNAMTVLRGEQLNVSLTNPYLANAQVMVMSEETQKKNLRDYDYKDLKFAVEDESSGERCIFEQGYKNTYTVKSQMDALKEIEKGNADATLIDSILADSVVGEGKTFPHLIKGLAFSSESCAVAFRKDSEMTDLFNEFIEKIRDEELIDLANKYGLTLC